MCNLSYKTHACVARVPSYLEKRLEWKSLFLGPIFLVTPHVDAVIDETPKKHLLVTIHWYIIFIGRAPWISCMRARERRREKLTIVVYFTHMEDATPGPTATTFALLGNLANVTNRTNFGADWFRGFRSVNGRKRHLPILKQDCS